MNVDIVWGITEGCSNISFSIKWVNIDFEIDTLSSSNRWYFGGVDFFLVFVKDISFCVINTSKILKLDVNEMKRLIERFYNDTYLVDQNACSSPHLILWLGKESKKAKNKFWNHLYYYVSNKYNLTESASIDKFTRLCENILLTKNWLSDICVSIYGNFRISKSSRI